MTPSLTVTTRLFSIELRRSPALLAVPILLGLAWLGWFIRQQEAGSPVAIWPDASEDIGLTTIFLGPAAGGLAAWVAGRERRHGLGDLLQTTTRPPTARHLNLLSATMAWSLLTYVVSGLYFGITTALGATWGHPIAAPILIGALTVATFAAMGYAAGSFATSAIQSRLTAALVPVLLFIFELAPTLIQGDDRPCGDGCMTSHYPYENLSPVALIQGTGGSIFWEPRADVAWGGLLWLGGLGAAALGLIAVRNRPRSLGAWGVTLAATAVAVSGWIQLVPSPVSDDSDAPIAYDPVCTQRSIEICLHPAYESVLDETADLVDPIVRPLAGLPGFPTRAVQIRTTYDGSPAELLTSGSATTDTLAIAPDCSKVPQRSEAAGVALAGVRAPSADPLGLDAAQGAIAIWLLRQSGWDPGDTLEVSSCTAEGTATMATRVDTDTVAAADRFGILTPDAQRAWLAANLAALRAGDLTLDDLP